MATTEQPRWAKVHVQQRADELVRLGWTLRHEFRPEGDEEPYEYLLEWTKDSKPVWPDQAQGEEPRPA